MRKINMTDTQKIFFGALMAFLVSMVVFILPLSELVHYFILCSLIFISAIIYDGFLRWGSVIKTTDNEWTDINHLRWVYNRMKHIHKENKDYDYMVRLKAIIDKLEKEYKDK